MWHASVALVGRRVTVPAERWGEGVHRFGILLSLKLLDGVGKPEDTDYMALKQLALHRRRPLSDAEIAALDPAWLAIPAVDHFSEEDDRCFPRIIPKR